MKTLSNAEFSSVLSIVAGNRLQQGQDSGACAAEETGKPVFSRLTMRDGIEFVLNTARFECAGVNFVNSQNQALDLEGVLSDFEAELEM